MNANSKITLICVSLLSSACATNMKEKIVRNTLVAGAIGAAVGSTKDQYKTSHELMYGATAAAITALASVYYYDPDQEISNAKKTTEKLRNELDHFENENTLGPSTSNFRRSTVAGPATNALGALPDKYKRLIKPGEWQLSEIDEWEKIDDTRMVHKTEMLELQPPILKSY